MPSPFPGMNPYLEQDDAWHDFHERFIPLAAELLGDQLHAHYIVKIDEHVFIHELPDEPRRLVGKPDVSVSAEPGSRPGAAGASAAMGVGILEAPATVGLPDIDEEHLSFVAIRDRNNRELVSVIELLSPANKQPGSNREQYLAKRGRLFAGGINLVEIDLLRGGPPLPAIGRPPCAYSVLVRRSERPGAPNFWPIGLREPLPRIPVPVRDPDPGATLDLQAMLHRIYDVARYARYIYKGRPDPPLGPEDAEWARSLIVNPEVIE